LKHRGTEGTEEEEGGERGRERGGCEDGEDVVDAIIDSARDTRIVIVSPLHSFAMTNLIKPQTHWLVVQTL